jgi:hypothetical protein
MVEDFDEIGSWPGRGDWHGRAEPRSQPADTTDQRLDVRRLRLVGTLSRAHFCHGGVTGNFLRLPCSISPEKNSGPQH